MPQMTENDDLVRAIEAWTDQMLRIGDSIPDFWDELNTSERLAEWLIACGYRKVEKPLVAIDSAEANAP